MAVKAAGFLFLLLLYVPLSRLLCNFRLLVKGLVSLILQESRASFFPVDGMKEESLWSSLGTECV